MAPKTKINAERLQSEFGLRVIAEFVPYSQSRNFKPDAKLGEKSLNWRVTLQHCATSPFAPEHNWHDVLTTDYGAGIGHCPSYPAYRSGFTLEEEAKLEHEIERGQPVYTMLMGTPTSGTKDNIIMPKPEDVVCSLILDGYAIDSPTYAEWAREYGYDEDSRKGEAIYRACLEIGLKLRASLGEAKLAKLREEFQDF